jgi:hypothetical protein
MLLPRQRGVELNKVEDAEYSGGEDADGRQTAST